MTRRSLLLMIVVVVALGALLLVLRSEGGSAGPAKTPGSSTGVPRTPGKPRPTLAPRALLTLRQYAARLLPVVSHSRPAFDRAVGSAASSATLSDLAQSCSRSVQFIGVQHDYVDGLPHPYPWYTPAGRLHHQVLGIYHAMLEGAVNCQTTGGNGDRGASDRAVSDMAKAARRLHAMVDRLRKLAAQPH